MNVRARIPPRTASGAAPRTYGNVHRRVAAHVGGLGVALAMPYVAETPVRPSVQPSRMSATPRPRDGTWESKLRARCVPAVMFGSRRRSAVHHHQCRRARESTRPASCHGADSPHAARGDAPGGENTGIRRSGVPLAIELDERYSRGAESLREGSVEVGVRTFVGTAGTWRLLVVLLLSWLTLTAYAQSASAVQAGRVITSGSCCSGHTLDGGYTMIALTSATGTSACNIDSAVIYSATAHRQVESGVARCASGSAVDTAACSGTFAFIERFDGAHYYCKYAGTYTPAPWIGTTIYRANESTGTYTGYILSSTYAQTGFNSAVAMYVWGEHNAVSTSCSGWTNSASFTNWEWLNTGGSSALGALVVSAPAYQTPGPTCYSIGSISSGSFYVVH